jgi:hypothetical protein
MPFGRTLDIAAAMVTVQGMVAVNYQESGSNTTCCCAGHCLHWLSPSAAYQDTVAVVEAVRTAVAVCVSSGLAFAMSCRRNHHNHGLGAILCQLRHSVA